MRILIRNFFMNTSLLLGEHLQIDTVEQAVQLFARDGMPARNLAAHTRKNYLHDLTDMKHFLAVRGVTTLATISVRHLQAYQGEMDNRGYASSTRNRKTQAIRMLFQFLHLHGIMEHNVAAKLIPPPIHKQEPRFLSEAEYQRLLRVASHHARDAAII